MGRERTAELSPLLIPLILIKSLLCQKPNHFRIPPPPPPNRKCGAGIVNGNSDHNSGTIKERASVSRWSDATGTSNTEDPKQTPSDYNILTIFPAKRHPPPI